MERLKETDEGLLLKVKATPGAKQNQIIGWEQDVLKIKVTAPPEKGKATLAVIRLLSKKLDIPQKNIILLQGATSRLKQFSLVGISAQHATSLLSI